MRGGELARVCQAIVLHGLDGAVDQPGHLAGMRRDDHVDAVASGEPFGLAREGVQRIGVEHERHAAALEQSVDERRGAGILAKARTAGHHVGIELENTLERGEVDGPGRGLVERQRSCIPHPSTPGSAGSCAASRP